jgi:hypothetical protein
MSKRDAASQSLGHSPTLNSFQSVTTDGDGTPLLQDTKKFQNGYVLAQGFVRMVHQTIELKKASVDGNDGVLV